MFLRIFIPISTHTLLNILHMHRRFGISTPCYLFACRYPYNHITMYSFYIHAFLRNAIVYVTNIYIYRMHVITHYLRIAHNKSTHAYI